jgi:hypothetical protein
VPVVRRRRRAQDVHLMDGRILGVS